MKTVVCLKHVPKDNALLNKGNKALDWVGKSGRINPCDRVAIEFALRNKQEGDEIIALSMGPPDAEDSLREAIAIGLSRAILLTDSRFAKSDTLATSYTLHRAIKKISEVDLIICGSRSIDSDTGHVGPQLAEFLELPLLSYITSFSIQGGEITSERIYDNLLETLSTELPALITINHKITESTYPSFRGLKKAYIEGDVTTWNAEAIEAEPEKIGLKGSATFVNKIFTPEKERIATMINDSGDEKTIHRLFELLMRENILLLDKHNRERTLE